MGGQSGGQTATDEQSTDERQDSTDESSGQSESESTTRPRTPTATLSPGSESGGGGPAALAAGDGDTGDGFGFSVALSGDGTTAVVSAPDDEDPSGESAGSAYVFERAGNGWTQTAKLGADDGDTGDQFGADVALSADGSTLLACAWQDEDPNGPQAGAAYVFERTNSGWAQVTKLRAQDGDAEDQFGRSVALSRDGSTALIGAYNDEDPDGASAGSAYVFEDSGGSWSQAAKLSRADAGDVGFFGRAAAIAADGRTAVIGAPDASPDGTQSGAGTVFVRETDGWRQDRSLSPSQRDENDRFGSAVALSRDGSTALVSAPQDEDPNGTGAGAAYVFSLS